VIKLCKSLYQRYKYICLLCPFDLHFHLSQDKRNVGRIKTVSSRIGANPLLFASISR
jgi:hypothetical protein